MTLQRQLRSLAVLATFFSAAGRAADPGFVVVVHQSNVLKGLSYSSLRALFDGSDTRWPNGTRVVLVERGAEGASTAFLTQKLLKVTLPEYKRHLANVENSGEEPALVRVLNS